MKEQKHFVAIDCGNSSYRVVLGTYDGQKIVTETVYQEQNQMVRIGDLYYWDILKIFSGLKVGLKKAITLSKKIDAIGVCTWGVDFALYDSKGNMIINPLSYRNTIGASELDKLSEIDRKNLFYSTGIVCDKINSVYMLKGLQTLMPEVCSITNKILMMPDIINYLLTGVMTNEPSELSTTQCMDSRTREISQEVCRQFGIDSNWFSKIPTHGTLLGDLVADIAEEIGADNQIPVVCVPSHDTAAAVAAIPCQDEEFLFISSGTWALIGAQLEEPVISEAVYRNNLTNEIGAFGKITLLKNSTGMFIMERLKMEYEEAIFEKTTWSEIIRIAETCQSKPVFFNVNNMDFFNPMKMSVAIWEYLKRTKQVEGNKNWEVIWQSVHYSMALNYATTIEEIENVTEKKYSDIYIVGGGTQNKLLNTLCSKLTGKKVIACAKESTSLGNIIAQIKYIYPEIRMQDLKTLIQDSIDIHSCESAQTDTTLKDVYKQLP